MTHYTHVKKTYRWGKNTATIDGHGMDYSGGLEEPPYYEETLDESTLEIVREQNNGKSLLLIPNGKWIRYAIVEKLYDSESVEHFDIPERDSEEK